MKNTTLGLLAAATLATSLATQAATDDLLGDVVPVTEATRTIVVTADTQYVNVTKGETVKFVENGQSFAVHFDGVRAAFTLNALAPTGSLDHPVMAYVSPSMDEED